MKRDENNHRLFDQRDINWLKGIQCLRACGLSINDLKDYLNLCLEGSSSIMERKIILSRKKELLLYDIERMKESVAFIDDKQDFYDRILSGEISYTSNLISVD